MHSEISLCRQRIKNAEKLFVMARLDEESLRLHIAENESQITQLHAGMNDEVQIRQMIGVTANMLIDMCERWHESSNEDKHTFAQALFSKMVFDLDTHQIKGLS